MENVNIFRESGPENSKRIVDSAGWAATATDLVEHDSRARGGADRVGQGQRRRRHARRVPVG
jgi:hypothetical protein